MFAVIVITSSCDGLTGVCITSCIVGAVVSVIFTLTGMFIIDSSRSLEYIVMLPEKLPEYDVSILAVTLYISPGGTEIVFSLSFMNSFLTMPNVLGSFAPEIIIESAIYPRSVP